MKGLINKIHEILGPLSQDDSERLKKSIEKNGVIIPIIIHKKTGKIIDGRHRIKFAKDYPKQEIDCNEKEAAKRMVTLNLARRHISPERKKELINLLRKAGFTQEEVGEMIGLTQSAIAKKENVNNMKIHNAYIPDLRTKLEKKDREEIERRLECKETQEQIAADYSISRPRVAQIKKKAKEKKEKEVKIKTRTKDIDSRIIIGDFWEKKDEIKNDSVDLMFTDPPYNQGMIKQYPDLAQFAADKLVEGGSLLFYAGHLQLVDASRIFSEKLRFWWVICCLHSGKKGLMKEYGIRVGWKPIFWFVKKTRDDPSSIVQDVVSGGEEKDYHEWQQAEKEALYWIEKLCPQDGMICDPFLGGGTTAVAAIKLNRKWIGIEESKKTAKIADNRIKDMENKL